jgi:hypothetical protein
MFTSTWAYRRGDAIEQAYYKTPLIKWLKEKGKVEEIRGHRRIEIPLEYGSNETVRWIGKGSTVPLTEGELFTMAYEDWKYVSATILRYGTEDQQNRGKARLIPYVERKVKAAERALAENFETVMFGDGTGTNEPNGLQNIIAAAPTTGTVHGINRATYTWFRNQYKTATGAASVYLVSDMRNLMNTITTYSKLEINDLAMFTTQTVWELYEDESLELLRFSSKDKGDPSFDTLTYRGRPIMWARSCPSGYMYCINAEYLKLVIDPDYYMDMTDWKTIPDQVNDKVAQIVCAMQLITTRPVAQGVLISIAA